MSVLLILLFDIFNVGIQGDLKKKPVSAAIITLPESLSTLFIFLKNEHNEPGVPSPPGTSPALHSSRFIAGCSSSGAQSSVSTDTISVPTHKPPFLLHILKADHSHTELPMHILQGISKGANCYFCQCFDYKIAQVLRHLF